MLKSRFQGLLLLVMVLSMTGCMPALQASSGSAETLEVIELAKSALAAHLGIEADTITVLDLSATEFADSSLGVREPGQQYLQVVTPGYRVRLSAQGEVYVYHGSVKRVVRVPTDQDPPTPAITIEHVQVTPTHVVISGRSALPNGTPVCSWLEIDGQPAEWWPEDSAVKVKDGLWRLTMALGKDDTAHSLDTAARYALHAQQQDEPRIASQPFCFDLAGPQTPEPIDVTLLLPDCAHILDQVSVDIDGDRGMEVIVLAAFGGSPDRLGYDWLQLFVIEPDRAAEYAIVFQSDHLAGDRGEKLAVRDINGDGRLEVLSKESMGAGGETLYVLARLDGSFYFLRPHGGAFGGLDRFGDNAVRLDDLDGDGVDEILAHYGPDACQFDIYRWNGQDYVYVETRSVS